MIDKELCLNTFTDVKNSANKLEEIFKENKNMKDNLNNIYTDFNMIEESVIHFKIYLSSLEDR